VMWGLIVADILAAVIGGAMAGGKDDQEDGGHSPPCAPG